MTDSSPESVVPAVREPKDAGLNNTRGEVGDVLAIAARYPGARRIRRLRDALELVDAGAASPQETRLRLLLVRSGLPKPTTQIPVTDAWGRVRLDDRAGQQHSAEESTGDSAR